MSELYPRFEADEKGSREIPVSDDSTGAQSIEVAVGVHSGASANPGELPAPVTDAEEPEVSELELA